MGPGIPNSSIGTQDPDPLRGYLGPQDIQVGPGTPYLIVVEIIVTFLPCTHAILGLVHFVELKATISFQGEILARQNLVFKLLKLSSLNAKVYII